MITGSFYLLTTFTHFLGTMLNSEITNKKHKNRRNVKRALIYRVRAAIGKLSIALLDLSENVCEFNDSKLTPVHVY